MLFIFRAVIFYLLLHDAATYKHAQCAYLYVNMGKQEHGDIGMIHFAKPFCGGHGYTYGIVNDEGDMGYYFYHCDGGGIDATKKISFIYTKNRGNECKNIVRYEYLDKTKFDEETTVKILNSVLGLSPLLSGKIFEKFGRESLKRITEDPDKLNTIQHSGNYLAKSIIKIREYIKNVEHMTLNRILTTFRKILNTDNVKSVISYYNGGGLTTDDITDEMIIRDFYKLCRVLQFSNMSDTSFKMVNDMAPNHSVDISAPERIKDVIEYIFRKLYSRGCVYIRKHNKEVSKMLISHNLNDLTSEIYAHMTCMVYDNKEYFTSEKLANIEADIENICDEFIENKRPRNVKIQRDLKANALQKKAIINAYRHYISIITGKPGTGKSYIVGEIIKLYKKNRDTEYHRFIILAPTGAAVERLRHGLDDINYDKTISTIHAFKYGCDHRKSCSIIGCSWCISVGDNFGSKEDLCRSLIIIDEMSMVDMKLFHSVLRICRGSMPNIVLLGDNNQLPSIAGGTVFADLINSGKIRCVELTEIYRSKDSAILNNADLIINGRNIIGNGASFEIIKIKKNGEQFEDEIRKVLSRKKITKYNSVILSPVNGKKYGTIKINEIAQSIYNCDGKKIFDTNMRIGDKIMQLENDNGKGIYNGSILIADSLQKCGEQDKKCEYSLICEYHPESPITNKDPRMIDYKYIVKSGYDINDHADINVLKLAYATTIHKAQGNGYDNVIIVIHSSMFHKLLTRNMLYTAVTRAKKKCIIIADKQGLNMCKSIASPRITGIYK